VDGKLKQRVVGVVVLTAIAIVVVPFLLDGTEQQRKRIVEGIPESPTLEVLDVNAVDIIDRMNTLEAESVAALPQEDVESIDTASSESGLDANGLPVLWSLQVASFDIRENATQLRTELRQKGFKVYILKVSDQSGDHFRVLIGPHMQHDRVEKIKLQVDAEYDLQAKIIQYDIKDDVGLLGG
jgi:DedD protein